MHRNAAAWLVLCAACAIAPAHACRAPVWRPLQQLDGYRFIFKGQVVGIRLDEAIRISMHGRDPRDLEHEDPQEWPYGGIDGVFSDATMAHTIDVLPIRPLKGKPPLQLQVTAGGCMFEEATLRAEGLFFVRDDMRAEAIYEHDPRYEALYEKARECTQRTCTAAELEQAEAEVNAVER